MIIGITGGSGCGKTTLLQLLQAYGFLVLDCDEIYHRLLETDKALLEAIEHRFPGTVTEGVLDRKKLGSLVFESPQALKALNTITHGAVKKEVLRRLEAAPGNAAIDAIGLFESGLNTLCNLTIAVTAPEECRVQRLMARESIPEGYARSRIAAQRPQAEFAALCDCSLANDGTAEEFREKCLAFFRSRDIITV